MFIFLVTVAAAMLLWRHVVSINDNYTVANGLVAVSRGRLYVIAPTFGETLASPGMVRTDGRAIPRNFAHIFLALPALWLLQALAAVADLRFALAGIWSLLLLGIVAVGGSLVGRERDGQVAGSLLALGTFGLSVWLATPLVVEHLAFLALQVTTIGVAGLGAVLIYRTVTRLHDAQTGLAAGLAVGLASPGLLWASIPKRHVLTAGFALVTLYLLLRSRQADEATQARRFRALAYVPVGLTAWLNAAEGVALLIALATVDLPTARENGLRTLGWVGGAFALSLVPLVVTNTLISGDPFTVPRMLPPYDSTDPTIRFGGGGGSPGGGGGSPGSGGGSSGGSGDNSTLPVIGPLIGLVATTLEPLGSVIARGSVFVGFLGDGVKASLRDPSKLYHTFVRSGWVGTQGRGATGLAINLAFLEALPLAGVLVAAPVVALRRLGRVDPLHSLRLHAITPAGTVDLFALAYTLILTLLYIPRFPLHAMLTVRYIYPLFPLAIYAVARLPAARAVVQERWLTLAFTYAAGVLVGSQVTLLTIITIGYDVDEAMQGYALLGLAVAVLLAAWGVASVLDRRDERLGAVLFGLAGGLSTNLLGLISYFYFGRSFVIPLVPL